MNRISTILFYVGKGGAFISDIDNHFHICIMKGIQNPESLSYGSHGGTNLWIFLRQFETEERSEE